jgi:hypothetical protein
MQVIRESKFMVLLIAMGVLVFLYLNWTNLKPLRTRKVLAASFCSLVAGSILSVLEELFWGDTLNVLQHACFSLSAVLLVIWSWIEFKNPKRDEDV